MASPVVYAEFIRELDDRGMLDWESAGGRTGLLGVFFVPSKPRMVLDTRGVNTMLIDPKTELPTSAAIAALESPAGHHVHLSQADNRERFLRHDGPLRASPVLLAPAHSCRPREEDDRVWRQPRPPPPHTPPGNADGVELELLFLPVSVDAGCQGVWVQRRRDRG